MTMNLPKVAIVGRPNVGKSALFNRLVGVKRAIVDDIPGVTRDRQYGETEWGGFYFTVIDTGGFVADAGAPTLEKAVRDQTMLAIEEADAVIFAVDGREGLLPAEEALGALLRKQKKPVFLAVNKIDEERNEAGIAEFYRLGFSKTFPVSAETSRGVSALLDALVPEISALEAGARRRADLKLAIVGRPNVGKSTLLNALIGEERAVVHAEAGTTRDPLNIVLTRGTRLIEIVDTAGIRRPAQTKGKLEKISVLKSFQTIDKSHLVLVLCDTEEGWTSQDLKVLNEAQERGKAAILVFNKWDLAPPGRTMQEIKREFRSSVKRNASVPMLALSAKTGRGVPNLFKLIDRVHENYLRRVSTGELNRVFQKAVRAHPHPVAQGQNVNLSYITQSGWGPPAFVVFANRPKLVGENYLRYLERAFRERFDFEGAPFRWILRQKK
jgi:GTP-binding protein